MWPELLPGGGGDNFFILKFFAQFDTRQTLAECSKNDPRQRPSLPMPAVCTTRQTLCRVDKCLYRVPLAHDKGGDSGSDCIYLGF